MKIFDWKKRAAFDSLVIPDGNNNSTFLLIFHRPYIFPYDSDYKLSVTTIFPIPGSRKRFLRVGRGISAGQGKTCGRGMRGQKSRKGNGAGVRAGFEGGQTALYRRLPKFQGSPQKGHTKTEFSLIKLAVLNEVADGAEVDWNALFEQGLVTKAKRTRRLFKVVGGAELTKKNLIVKAHAFTESARTAIEENGGTCVLMSRTRPITAAQAEKERIVKVTEQRKQLKARRALKAARALAKEMAV